MYNQLLDKDGKMLPGYKAERTIMDAGLDLYDPEVDSDAQKYETY